MRRSNDIAHLKNVLLTHERPSHERPAHDSLSCNAGATNDLVSFLSSGCRSCAKTNSRKNRPTWPELLAGPGKMAATLNCLVICSEISQIDKNQILSFGGRTQVCTSWQKHSRIFRGPQKQGTDEFIQGSAAECKKPDGGRRERRVRQQAVDLVAVKNNSDSRELCIFLLS